MQSLSQQAAKSGEIRAKRVDEIKAEAGCHACAFQGAGLQVQCHKVRDAPEMFSNSTLPVQWPQAAKEAALAQLQGSNEGQDSKEAQEKEKGKNANEAAEEAAWLFGVPLVESSSTLHEPILPLCAVQVPNGHKKADEKAKAEDEKKRKEASAMEEAVRERKDEEEQKRKEVEKAKGCRVHCEIAGGSCEGQGSFEGPSEESQVDCSVRWFMMDLHQQTLRHSGPAPF